MKLRVGHLDVENKRKDLDEFKITCRNRLSPEATVGFMLGSII